MLHPLFIIIPVLLPILGGALMLLMHIRKEGTRIAVCEVLVCVTSLFVWLLLLKGSRQTVTVFRFANDFSLTFRIDGMASLFAGMVSVMWPLATLYGFSYMKHEERKNVFFAFYVMTYGVTLGVAFSANLLSMYVFFEMLTLVTIPLVVHYGNSESSYAGRKYAAYTIGGAALAFFAVIITSLYGGADHFTYGGMITGNPNARLLQAAYLLGFFGFGTKAALFPLYEWLPAASVAPTPVTALLHAVAVVNSGAFAVMRMSWYVYGPDRLLGTSAQTFAVCISVFSLMFGAVMAVKERHFKRKLAFSTMSNLSYMLFGAALLTPEGLCGGMAHMLFHGIIKITLFMCAGAFMHMSGKEYVYEIGGAGRHMPVTFTAFTLASLSLIGIPGFSGFISKWELMKAGFRAGTPWGLMGTCALIAAAFLCALYTLPISVRAFFPMEGGDRFPGRGSLLEADKMMLTPVLFFAAADIVFGVASGPVMEFLRGIAEGRL